MSKLSPKFVALGILGFTIAPALGQSTTIDGYYMANASNSCPTLTTVSLHCNFPCCTDRKVSRRFSCVLSNCHDRRCYFIRGRIGCSIKLSSANIFDKRSWSLI